MSGADFEAVPTLDGAALRRGDPAERARLTATAHAVGFFYVTGHGCEDAAASAFDAAERFFALPPEAKQKLSNVHSPAFRGYIGLGAENTRGIPDLREQVELGVEAPAAERGAMPPFLRLQGPNLWPPEEEAPGVRADLTRFMDEMTVFSEVLVAELAEGLGLGRGALEDAFVRGEPNVQMKIARYPPRKEGGFGVGAHTDSGFLSILLQDDRVGGLQVQNGAGEWIDVPPVPGTVVVNVGEMLQLATGGYLVATPHRVLPNEDESLPARISVPYFYNPALTAVVEPLERPEGTAWEWARPPPPPEDARNRLISEYGTNALKSLARSHPAVFERHHAHDLELLTDGTVVERAPAGA